MKIRGVWRGFTDRSKWPPGEWDHEPDKVEWVDQATGLPCIIHRGTSGSWCGYVGVAPGHPLHGVEYTGCSEKPGCGVDWCDHQPDAMFQVHGGLTYSGPCVERDDEWGVCHKPLPGEPDDVWWFGFDTAHCFDLVPGHIWVHNEVKEKAILEGRLDADFELKETYRNQEYVMAECANLAAQLNFREL